MENRSERVRLLLGVSLSICMLLNANNSIAADPGDAVKVFVTQDLYYDSNIYRLPDGVSAPDGERSDWVGITGIGITFDRAYSLQRLFAEIGIDRTYHAVHKSLDYSGGKADLRWDWALGRHWSGQLGHLHREVSTPDDDFIGSSESINVFRRSNASADFWFHPDWAVGGGASQVSSRFRDGARPASEYDADIADFNLTYRPKSGNRVVLSLRQTDGEYPNRPAVAGSMREYRQREVRLSGDWQATGKLRVYGYLGRTERSYEFAPNRDFEGSTGRITFNWTPTGKTTVDLSLRREIGAEEDVVANFAVTEAATLRARWAMTAKLTLGAEFEARRRDFGGDPGLAAAPGGSSGDDERSYLYGLNLTYVPLRSTTVSFAVARRVRTAGDAFREFDGYVARVSAKLAF